ncbi:MAG TPA: shikimate kinase [Aquabacterium sp.]|uniref:shikimate kinase n=1 Tax=Aquabacterium sp. TaxID=1872578 RepID=UPI002E2FCB4B|nr:shikimate kinase [Aquabacterium sp.]HEX5374072.1 shikimate kinase [Aquabacterium sp.]
MLISLIGLPGGGKSTVGKQLAKRLGVRFLDADTVLEERIGMPIRSFFEQRGEAAFRDLEEQVLDELTLPAEGGESSGLVLATGGGAVLRPINRERLKARSTVVYLRSTPEELYRRLKHDTQRPLLQVPDPMAKLRELYAQRHPLYEQTAHYAVDTGRPSVSTLVNMILMQLDMAGIRPSPPSPVEGGGEQAPR